MAVRESSTTCAGPADPLCWVADDDRKVINIFGDDGCYIWVKNSNGGLNWGLPLTANNDGNKVIIVNNGTGNITLFRQGTDTINGNTSVTVGANSANTFVANTANGEWLRVSEY